MMDCKHALTDAKGDFEQAIVLLRRKGVSVAAKKATRVTSEGSVAQYIHAGGKTLDLKSATLARPSPYQSRNKKLSKGRRRAP